jgi:acetoin utilization protein AcuB
MTKNPFYTNPKEQIYNVKSMMDREKFSKVPVLDDSGKLVGVVTKTELKKAMPSEATTLDIYELGYLLSKITVEKVMKKDPITIQKDATIETGYTIKVPLFINLGEKILVSTSDGKYAGRA